jgi:hypothetical protein
MEHDLLSIHPYMHISAPYTLEARLQLRQSHNLIQNSLLAAAQRRP